MIPEDAPVIGTSTWPVPLPEVPLGGTLIRWRTDVPYPVWYRYRPSNATLGAT